MKSSHDSPRGKSVTSIPIRVTIFDHSEEEHCSGLCRVAWSVEEVAFVTEHLKRKYGNEIEVEYIDLAESPQNSDVMEKIRTKNIPLPVVAINGVLKLSGSVEIRAIKEAIEAQIEVGCG
jgi:disulfide oxidoreductase YuzD